MNDNVSEVFQEQFTVTLNSFATSQRGRASRKSKVEWTKVMCDNLLECREKVKSITESEAAPRKSNGRKVGYMEVMLSLWNEKGYSQLNLTAQNLRDRASQLLKKKGNVQETIDREISRPTDILISDTELNDDLLQEASNQISQENANLVDDGNRFQREIPHLENSNNEDEKYYAKAKEIFNGIQGNVGDYTGRQYDTRTKKIPSRKEIENLNKVTTNLINDQKFTSTTNPLTLLWKINCIVYAIAVAWVILNNIKVRAHNTTRSFNNVQPKWLREIETQVKETRAKISKATAEIERLKCNGKLRKNGRRNRRELAEECNVLSIRELVVLIEKKKVLLRKLSRKRRRKLSQLEAKKLNDMFKNKTSKVLEKFKDIIKEDPSNVYPVFRSNSDWNANGDAKYFDSTTEVERFWENLWSVQGMGNSNPLWVKDIEEKFCEIIPEMDEGIQRVDNDTVWSAIRKKRNWSSPGPDSIVNFWWKKIDATHNWVRVAFHQLLNQSYQIPQWFSSGKTFLIPKDGIWSVDNQRPITCTNTLYKWYTSIILGKLDSHLAKYNLMQIDQRGARVNCNGTTENLFIDGMVLNDARNNNRNLSCAWIDIRKAYDTLSHEWLIKSLDIHRVPTKVTDAVKRIVRSWSVKLMVPTQNNLVESSTICFKRGILQGDSMCPKIFTMAINPIAWSIRSSEGYRMSKPLQGHKITHNLFIDDLKIYAGSELKLVNVMGEVKHQMEDAGLEWSESKCSVVHMKRGKMQCTGGNIQMDDNTLVKALESGQFYKFLGVPEADRQSVSKLMERLKKELTQRVSVIWSSPLSDYNKIHGTNCFAIPIVLYAMWSQRINLEELRDMDRIIRRIMTENSAKHPKLSNASLYLSRQHGGRGLTSLEQLYKETRIKTMEYILKSNDPRIEILAQHEHVKASKNRASIIKDGEQFANELGLEILEDMRIRIRSVEDKSDQPKSVKETIKEARMLKWKQEIAQQTWQGVILSARFHDSCLDRASFQWLSRWKECPVSLVTEVQGLYNQLLPTKTYQLIRSVQPPYDTVCRLCNRSQESVMHILSNCSKLAEVDYLRRHNNALKMVIVELLLRYRFIQERPSWYSAIEVKPYYDNNEVTIWWDIPEVYNNDTDSVAKRPDAKIWYKKEKKIIIIEQSVPWVSNREDKEKEKQDKYADVRRNNKLRYSGHDVDQANLIMDVLGGFSPSLRENLKKLISRDKLEGVIFRMQKVVVSEAAHIARKFKLYVN